MDDDLQFAAEMLCCQIAANMEMCYHSLEFQHRTREGDQHRRDDQHGDHFHRQQQTADDDVKNEKVQGDCKDRVQSSSCLQV